MSELPRDFWPDDIVPHSRVLTPLGILRQVAGQLPEKSRNLYEAEVSTDEDFDEHGNPWFVHTFNIVAPGLNRYARSLFRVEHAKDEVYPANLISNGTEWKTCSTQEELMIAIQNTLASPKTKAIFYSLAAKLNEVSIAS